MDLNKTIYSFRTLLDLFFYVLHGDSYLGGGRPNPTNPPWLQAWKVNRSNLEHCMHGMAI